MQSSSYTANWQVATLSPMSLCKMSQSRKSLSRMSLSPMSLSRMSLSRISLSLMSLSPMSLSAWRNMVAWKMRSVPLVVLQSQHACGLESGSCLVSFLRCTQFISDTDQGTRGGVLFVWVRVVGLCVSIVLIY
jgi:hypothetical protein